MATQSKTASITKSGKPRKPRTVAPKMDFAALAETVEETTKPKSGRKSLHENTPFPAWIQETYDNGTGKAVTIPNANVVQVSNVIRSAADSLGLGASIRVDDLKNGHSKITFAGKARRKYTPRANKA